MGTRRPFSRPTLDAMSLLGAQVRLGRRQRRWTIKELAERVGVCHVTIRRVEHGDPRVALGIALEAAVLTGVPLFHVDPEWRKLEVERVADRLALLPQRVRESKALSDSF